jgi:hypothetical protein
LEEIPFWFFCYLNQSETIQNMFYSENESPAFLAGQNQSDKSPKKIWENLPNESYVSSERSHLSLNRSSCDGCPLPTLGCYRSLIGSRHCWPIKIAGLSLPFYLHPFVEICRPMSRCVLHASPSITRSNGGKEIGPVVASRLQQTHFSV